MGIFSFDTENINLFNKTEMAHADRYILRGSGVEEFASSFFITDSVLQARGGF
jgi:hypothetical protein